MKTTPSNSSRLFVLQRGLCFYCGERMELNVYRKREFPRGWTLDHLLPVSLGFGKEHNIVLAHVTCNSRKGHRLPSEQEIERFLLLFDVHQREKIRERIERARHLIASPPPEQEPKAWPRPSWIDGRCEWLTPAQLRARIKQSQ